VSQVMPMPDDMLPTMEDVTNSAEHILVVKSTKKSQKYHEVTFPIETHYQKAEETVYTENINEYEVLKVIKSKKIEVNKKIWVWTSPSYGEEIMKIHHEDGLLESPFVMMYKPKFPIINDEEFIIFLKDLPKPKISNVYYNFDYAQEGIKASPQVFKILKE
jgi:hypothetical protein